MSPACGRVTCFKGLIPIDCQAPALVEALVDPFLRLEDGDIRVVEPFFLDGRMWPIPQGSRRWLNELVDVFRDGDLEVVMPFQALQQLRV